MPVLLPLAPPLEGEDALGMGVGMGMECVRTGLLMLGITRKLGMSAESDGRRDSLGVPAPAPAPVPAPVDEEDDEDPPVSEEEMERCRGEGTEEGAGDEDAEADDMLWS